MINHEVALAMKIQMKILKTLRKMDIIQLIISKTIFQIEICFSEIIDHRYLALKKLGWGHFSTVWLVLKI